MVGATMGLLALLAGAFWLLRPGTDPEPQHEFSVVAAQRGEMRATVGASGVVAAEAEAQLSFSRGGVVREVLVQVGDQVQAGQVLARLQDDALELEVRRAEAQLRQTQANLDRLLAGATPEEIEAARAQVAAAQGSLQQVQGNVTAADLAAAQAQVDQAQAQLERLLAGPQSTELATALAQLQQAEAQRDSAAAALQQTRDSLSAAKTQAELNVEQAANVVRDRQAEYNRIREANQQLRDRGFDVPKEAQDAEETALRAVENAEDQLRQALVVAEEARQREVTGVAQAEAQLQQAEAAVEQARANLEKVQAGAEDAEIAAAKAQLEQARANLERLRGGSRSGSLAAARAQVDQAQANLERLQADPSASDLAQAQAQVDAAQAALDLARLNLSETALKAPFSGTIADVQLVPGAQSVPQAITIVDLSRLHIDATIDEIDIARVAIGQPVEITLDALNGQSFAGVVRAISPRAISQGGATSYKVRIDIHDAGKSVLPGMSASVTINVAERANALLIPRRALHSEGQRTFVQRVVAPGPPGGMPQLEEVEVVIGLSNEQVVEVLSGLNDGDEVFVEGVSINFFDLLNGGGPGRRR